MSHGTDSTTSGEAVAGRARTETYAASTHAAWWLVAGLVALAGALAANSLLGPLAFDVVEYPLSETLLNQTVGLEAVTLAVVVPWTLAAAYAFARRHRGAPVLAIPPTGYAAYMFVQYVVGPEYPTYQPVVLLHLAIFVASGALLVLAWQRVTVDALPDLSRTAERRAAVVLALFALFTVFRYVPLYAGVTTDAALGAEFAADPSMFWSIVLLDLGVVVPITVATAVQLFRGRDWGRRAAYGVAGWFVLVPVSVAAMSVAMLLNDDPYAATGDVAMFVGVSVVFVAFAAWLYRPLLSRRAA
jgi:hypothetical protein